MSGLLLPPNQFRPGARLYRSQGRGNHVTNHCCAGEWSTVDVVKAAVHLLTTEMRYKVPAQDLQIKLLRMPALPESGFVVESVRPTG